MIQPSGPCPARIMVVGEAPDEQSFYRGEPFCGYSGEELSRMLTDAGIMRAECFITTVIRIQSPLGKPESFFAEKKTAITSSHTELNGAHVLHPVLDGIAHLRREIAICQPNIIIAMGNIALWALTGNLGITKWRGSKLSILPSLSDRPIKVLPTYAPEKVLAKWEWRPITVHDLRTAKAESLTETYNPPDYDFIISPDYKTTLSTIETLQGRCQNGPLPLAVDIETRLYNISCIGLAWSKLEAICIPLMQSGSGTDRNYWALEEESNIVFQLYRLLTHPNCRVLGQNFIYDAQYIHRYWGFIPNLHFDTMTGQHTMYSNMQKSLDFLSSMYCQHHVYWKEEGKEMVAAKNALENWEYNCKDCVATYEIWTVIAPAIKAMGLQEVGDFQQYLFWPVLNAMIMGVRTDKKLRASFAIQLQEAIAKREQFFIDVLGHPLNPRSAPQMQNLFYKEFGQKKVFDKKTRRPTCNDEAMRVIGNREPLLRPLCTAISEYRSLGIFLSTYVNAPLDWDDRIRCTFGVSGTETYRFNSKKNSFGSGMNLQNVSTGEGEEGDDFNLPNVKEIFLPDEGYTFFDIDLDSADLRIVCEEANIPEMRAMINEGKKVYVEVMKEYYHDPTLTKHSPQYRIFKSLCHGTHYLGTARGLAERLGLGVREIEVIQKWYFGKFPELQKWQADFKEKLVKERVVSNVFGYRCHVLDKIRFLKGGNIAGTIANQFIAWIPQSTVACIINRGLVNIHKNLPEVKVPLQVHDSLAGQFPTRLGDWAKRRIIEECSITLPYPNPIVIPVDIKTSTRSWGGCK